MNEQEFTDELKSKIYFQKDRFLLGTKIPLLYAVTITEDGRVNLGVTTDTGEPLRGRGTGFEQDLLIYENVLETNTSIIPRVIVEVKYPKVTSHDAIIYSEKAKRIKTIYPYVRYGFLLGGMSNIPPRVIRLGVEFDFIQSLQYPFNEQNIQSFRELLLSELESSLQISEILSGNNRITTYRNHLEINHH